MVSIVGREPELSQLQSIYEAKEAVFLTVYGRRRIGKTYLIKQFFEDKGVYFQLTGVHNVLASVQLNNFTTEFNDKFCFKEFISQPKNWTVAFDLLRRKVQELVKTNTKDKIILFFDELPWLASKRSGFLNALEHCWNRYLSDIDNVILIVCGSAASWMIENVINTKGGLHGRVTHEIRLLPFTLCEVESYLKSRQQEYSRKQIIDLYMAFGGVAQYLKFVERGKSIAQNINDICFKSAGGLYNEFHKLYRSLFDQD